MRKVTMPPPAYRERQVVIPDDQCGYPVLDGRDGNMEYYPCNLPYGHTDPRQHTSDASCPYTEPSLFRGTEYRCTRTAFHEMPHNLARRNVT